MVEETAPIPVTDFDLAELYGSAGALARSMRAYTSEQIGRASVLADHFLRALILADGELIAGAHLGIVGHSPAAAGVLFRPTAVEGAEPVTQPLAEVEKQSVVEALRRAKGNKSHAAAALGLSRGALYTRLRRFRLIV
jgi:DNA-binding NtrC family response regulator